MNFIQASANVTHLLTLFLPATIHTHTYFPSENFFIAVIAALCVVLLHYTFLFSFQRFSFANVIENNSNNNNNYNKMIEYWYWNIWLLKSKSILLVCFKSIKSNQIIVMDYIENWLVSWMKIKNKISYDIANVWMAMKFNRWKILNIVFFHFM